MSALELINKAVDKVIISCKTDPVAVPVYAGQLITIDVPGQVDPNQIFAVNVKIKNTGNIPWFSSGSGCTGQDITYLGTTRDQDRESVFHAPIVFGNTNWYTNNRIKLKTPRVNPGEVAEFMFVGHAPTTPGIYREYFAPVVEGKAGSKTRRNSNLTSKWGFPQKRIKY